MRVHTSLQFVSDRPRACIAVETTNNTLSVFVTMKYNWHDAIINQSIDKSICPSISQSINHGSI